LIQKHHLQVTLSANTPPINGPRIEQIPNVAPIIPAMIGRFGNGATRTTMVVAPENRPAAPKPATPLPTMNTSEVGADAHNIEPISKKLSAAKNTHFTLKKA
jgi:hypothetical protein